jgi:hypothetical protein
MRDLGTECMVGPIYLIHGGSFDEVETCEEADGDYEKVEILRSGKDQRDLHTNTCG